MEVKYSYSKKQLELTVNYIATHNPHFLGQHYNIHIRILNTMEDVVRQFPNCYAMSTMGFLVVPEDIEEAFRNGPNFLNFEFYVDPAGDLDHYPDDDTVFNTMTIDTQF